MSSCLTVELPRVLARLPRPGHFCGSGEVELPVLRVAVTDVGPLGLPLSASQAAALVATAAPAPYGRGPDTLADPAVRRCGQIAAADVHLDPTRWPPLLDAVVARACAELGVTGQVHAELYKMLVYEPGGFFTTHRDTEKAPGMFATLVVALPCEHSGGELVVRHDGREATLDLTGGAARGVARWAAFYTDCAHELLPVREGYRVALVYNLVRPKGRPPRPPADPGPEVARLAHLLGAWGEEPGAPTKLVVPLSHRYSLAELAFYRLKGGDAVAADALEDAAAASECVLRLAILAIEESGEAYVVHHGRRGRYGGWEPEMFEAGEVYDRSRTVSGWRRPDDTEDPRPRIAFDEDEIAPPDALADVEPEEEFHENTGNEGCTFERTYRRAAFVLWPRSHELRLLLQAGTDASLDALERLLAARDPDAARLGDLLADTWPIHELSKRRARLLRLLLRSPYAAALDRFVHRVLPETTLDAEEIEPLAWALTAIGGSRAGALLERIVARAGADRFALGARLASEARGLRTRLRPAVEALVALLPAVAPWTAWRDGTGPTSRAEGLAALAGAVAALGPPDEALVQALAGGTVDPARWPLDEVLVPALLRVAEDRTGLDLGPLRARVLDALRARAALPLTPPADASRSADGLVHGCVVCASLRAFLVDPDVWTWAYKAKESDRAHVEDVLGRARSDVDRRLDLRTNPRTLVCTKNTASYDARVKQRESDLAAIAVLSRR